MLSSCETWTEEERRILRDCYRMKTKQELLSLFPGRSWGSIAAMAKRLRVFRFKGSGSTIQLQPEVARVAAWAIACEGSISLKTDRGYLHPLVGLFNTRPELIMKFHHLVKCGAFRAHKYHREGTQKMYLWELHGIPVCFSFLSQIEPFLPIKKEACALVIEFCRHRLQNGNKSPYMERDWQIHQEVVTLNMTSRGRGGKGEEV